MFPTLNKVVTFLACVSITATDCWVLEVNQNSVTPQLTTNITISCYHDNNGNKSTITDLYRIRISKFNNNQEWDSVAAMSLRDPVVKTSFADASVSGHVDTPDNTFIQIHFEIASEETVGQFLCEIDGFDDHMDVTAIKTNPVVISKKKDGPYDGILEHLLDLEKQEKEDALELKGLKELLHILESKNNNVSQTINSLEQHDETIDNRINNLDNKLSNVIGKQNEIIDLIKQLQQRDCCSTPGAVTTVNPLTSKPVSTEIPLQWPGGYYKLPKPKYGCPGPQSTPWDFSSIRLSTHLGDSKNDTSSQQLNLSGAVFQRINDNNYVQFYYCTMNPSEVRTDPNWPRGSYCIDYYRSKCPAGLQVGRLRYGRYNDDKKVVGVNIGDYSYSDSHTDIYFCCRSDGDPSDPISLPRGDPFYLYRHNGVCQEVSGMTATNEWIHLVGGYYGYPTEYVENTDNHPDGFANGQDGLRLELCYYTPSL